MADLRRVCRILLRLKATEEFLRQYPQLAAKLDTALAAAAKPARPAY